MDARNLDSGLLITHGGKRVLVDDAISYDSTLSLRKKTGRLSWEDPRIREPLDWMRSFFPVVIGDNAYAVVEQMKSGHPWHTDIGTNSHMPWCRYSASVGLSPREDYTGGDFHFRDMGPLHMFKGMIAYTSDFEHKVTSHKGDRVVLLMFFEGEDG
tara:strand:- start:1105 stop:1572 length:468 start_codon:yes stop_codon:yes gene_type:complete